MSKQTDLASIREKLSTFRKVHRIALDVSPDVSAKAHRYQILWGKPSGSGRFMWREISPLMTKTETDRFLDGMMRGLALSRTRP